MRLDLSTLLLVRLFIDGFLVALYWLFVRRYPAIGGPHWWAGAAIASALATLGAAWATVGGGGLTLLTVAGSMTAISVSYVLLWLGIRSHLGLPMRRALRWAAVGCLAILVAQAGAFELWDSPALRRALFVVTVMVLTVLSLWHLRLKGASNSATEFKALRILLRVELLLLSLILARLLIVSLGSGGYSLADGAPFVVLFVTLDSLVRTALLSAMVMHRLQQGRERDRQKLREGRADLRALIDNIHAGVIVLRPDRSIETINASAREFLGHAQASAVEGSQEPKLVDWALLGEDGQPMPRHEMPFERVLGTGQPLKDVIFGVQPEGQAQVRWALCNAFAENDQLGGLRHVVLTFVDITSLQAAQRDQKNLQAQLSQSQKMQALGTLAGGVAHDFNNILAAILGNAELARQDAAEVATAVQSLDEISGAARRGRELVRQILAFSRQQPMERKRVSMRAILAECCGLLKPGMPSHVKLGTACGPGELSINADATQLGQVLLNLGTNALHAFCGKPGELTIQVNRFSLGSSLVPSTVPKDWLGVIRVQVTDNGCGMDEATQQRIFEPFFTTRKLGTGTGLGLPVVIGIVEGHDGLIEVKSKLGEGTTFTLYFPAAVTDPGKSYVDSDWPRGDAQSRLVDDHDSDIFQPADMKVTKDASSVQNATMTAETPSTHRHVLYLDDDDTLVFLVRRLLERRGFTVTTFTDQQEAIDAVKAQPNGFDLLMTDFNMPGMSGLDVARAVLAINPLLPVAVASGYITDELQVEAKAAGVQEVVFKTDAVEDFCTVVARLVDKGQA